MANSAVPKPKQLQRNFIIVAVTGVIIAIILGLLRKNRDVLGQVPGVGDFLNFVMPETDFKTPGVNIGGVNMPTVSRPDLSGGFNYPPTNSCGCGGAGGGPELVSETEIIHNYGNAAVNVLPPLNIAYQPPPCFERFSVRKMFEQNQTKVTNIWRQDYKGRERARMSGYADNPEGLLEWAWDSGAITQQGERLYYNRGKDQGQQRNEGTIINGILQLGSFFRGVFLDANLGLKSDYVECM